MPKLDNGVSFWPPKCGWAHVTQSHWQNHTRRTERKAAETTLEPLTSNGFESSAHVS